MILTKNLIIKEYYSGNITLEPFEINHVKSHSYLFRLGNKLKIFNGFDNHKKAIFQTKHIADEGYILEPHTMYLGQIYEIIGSKIYAMSLTGINSISNLGLSLHISANLGHTTSSHQWLKWPNAPKMYFYI